MTLLDLKRMTALAVLSMLTFLCKVLEGSPAVGVVGGVANVNITVTNKAITANRDVLDPNKTKIIIFFVDKTEPSYTVPGVTYTGNISEGFVSFTLSNLRKESAGLYQYVMASTNVTAGEQYLVIAETPSKPIIDGISVPALAGRDYKLHCSAVSTSEKPGHNLTMYSEWKRNGANITANNKYDVNGTILTIQNLNKTDNSDRFTCIAFEDQRKKSAESNEFLLNVYYGPDNIQIAPSGEFTVDEGRLLNITCYGECNPPCNSYQWHKDQQHTLVGSSQTLVITNVSREHTGVYICTINNTYIPDIGTAQTTVRVNYGPDRIMLFPSQMSYEVAENSSLYVNCSANCIPNCEYRWTVPSGNYPEKTGLLSISKITRSQAGVFICTAINPSITSNSATATVLVTVQYGPDSITLTPSNISYERLENSSLSVNCSSDCVPSCKYRWTSTGESFPQDTAILSISSIKRDQAGVFTCSVTNSKLTDKLATATVSVTVYYGPDFPLKLNPANESYRSVEGATIPNISCTSDCFPSCNFNWTGPVMSSTGVISLGTLHRSESGNFKCRGENTRTKRHADSKEVRIIVIYGPDSPVLTPNDTLYTINESNTLSEIRCSTDCFPNCTSHWYKEQMVLYGNPPNILSLGNVYRNATGTYRCRSENTESNATAEKSVQVVINYSPVVTIETRNGSYNETDLLLKCSAQGVPEQYFFTLTHISLFTGIKIRNPSFDYVFTGVIIHQFSSFMDTGIYTCTVNNGITDYIDGSVNKSLSATVWIKGLPFMTSSNTSFHAEKGYSGRLAIEFYNSLLDPNVTWYRQRNQSLEKLDSSDKYNISVLNTSVTLNYYSVHIQQPGFFAELEIRNVTVEDFGSYQVKVQNSVGLMPSGVLNLRPRGPPEVPQGVQIVPGSITTVSVGMEWVSGFHGGYDQTFFVEYKEQADANWREFSYIFGGMTQYEYFNITVAGLHQGTMYLFRVYAQNTYNKSEYSVVINATTSLEIKEEMKADNEPTKVALIVGITVGGVLIGFILGGGVLIYKRRRIPTLNNDGLVANPVYESSGTPIGYVNNSDVTGDEYAKVVKPKKYSNQTEDLSSLYAQVDKTSKTGRKGTGKAKHQKTLKGEIYENAELVGKGSNPESLYENSRNAKTKATHDNVYQNPEAAANNGPSVNTDGLLYADLMLSPPSTRNGKPVIRGMENRTDYAEIAYGIRGDPCPDSDDGINSNGAKENKDQ